jgi:guanylate kinase
MKDEQKGRLVILSGPSCVGKSPLAKALARFYPEIWSTFNPLVLYNSRTARPGEKDGIDYHFRSRTEIENLKRKEGFIVMDVREDLHALDLKELLETLDKGNVFYEGSPYIGKTLLTHPMLTNVNRLSIFMSPLTRDEIIFLKTAEPKVSLPEIVTDIMRRKLLRRTRRQKGKPSLKELEDIEIRALSAYYEMQEAYNYQYVISNHDGEDSENWDAFYYPLGDARVSLIKFIALLEGKVPDGIENWEEDLVP